MKINHEVLEVTEEMKLLGVKITNDLKWNLNKNKPAAQAAGADRPFPMKLHQWPKSTHSAKSP